MRQARAVLWDLDGTLVDSQPYWFESETELARRHGFAWTEEDSLALVGLDMMDAGRYVCGLTTRPLTPEQVVEELIDGVVWRMQEHVPWRPGARELLEALASRGVPNALVTMSYRRFVTPVLAALPRNTFAAIVTGDEVSRGKPHPDPYLAGATATGVEASACVAVEDSLTGMRSALAAGCRVLVVPSHAPVPTEAHRHATSLTALSVDEVLAV